MQSAGYLVGGYEILIDNEASSFRCLQGDDSHLPEELKKN
jgi:hypothetical protein